MKSAGKARNNGLYRHIRTSKEIIRNLLNDSWKNYIDFGARLSQGAFLMSRINDVPCRDIQSVRSYFVV